MATVLTLNPFEHLNLWMESLVVYHRDSGIYLSSQKSLPEDHNYREDLSGTCMVNQEIIRALPHVLRDALAELPKHPKVSKLAESKLRDLVRRNSQLAKELGELVELWDFVIRYQTIGNCLLSTTRMNRTEFKSYTSILAREISRYCNTECHRTLLRRFHQTKIQHKILRDILLQIDIDGVREELERVLAQFFSLLGVVSYFQTALSRSFQVHKFNVLLVYIHHSAQRLLGRLDRAYEYIDYCQPELSQGLAPVKFGLRIEFRNIFKRELREVETKKGLEERFSQIENAIGQLKQTAEEAFISLVHHFNPDFNEHELFVDKQQQVLDSSKLQDDLKKLYKLILRVVDDPVDEGFAQLQTSLRQFRGGTMRALFYKDWQPFEKFAQELTSVEPQERAFLVHRFEVYVSTLLGEVSKRSVLTKAINYPDKLASSS